MNKKMHTKLNQKMNRKIPHRDKQRSTNGQAEGWLAPVACANAKRLAPPVAKQQHSGSLFGWHDGTTKATT